MSLSDNSEVASPGHKLGQMVGMILQGTLKAPLQKIALGKGLYCDCQGPRPGVREGTKVTWVDLHGIPHDLDYVFERNASPFKRGEPVAFIEVAWRRYTKHSRAKSGEIEGALLPLSQTFPSVRFLGAIIAGEYTEQGLEQLRRSGISVMAISFNIIRDVFASENVKIDYPEKASAQEKAELNRVLESLNQTQLKKIPEHLWKSIERDYGEFERRLTAELERVPKSIRVVTLLGYDRTFSTIEEAIKALEVETRTIAPSLSEQGYEVFVEFATGSKIDARFKTKDELMRFLNQIR